MAKDANAQALRLLFITVFLDLLGFGLIIPQLPYYAVKCGASAELIGMIGASYSLLQFLMSPFWGRLSDRVGRRPIIVTGLVGSGISFLIFGGAFLIHDHTGIGLIPILFFSRSLAGAFNANISVAQAYVADISAPEERNKKMGMIGAAFGLGFIFGPGFSVLLSQAFNAEAPFYVAGVIALITSVFAFLRLPESRREKGGEPGHSSLRSLSLGKLGTPALKLSAVCLFLSTFCMGGMENTLGLLVQDSPRLKFTDRDFGILVLFMGVIVALTQGLLVRKLAHKVPEAKMVQAGSLVMMVSLGLIGDSPNTVVVYLLAAGVAMGNGLINPSLASLSSILAPAGSVGEVLGVNQGMSSLGRILGPVTAGSLYYRQGMASPYRATGVVMALCFALAVMLESSTARERPGA